MRRLSWMLALGAVAILWAPAAAQERQIKVEVTVGAPVAQAWALWSTNEGVRSFFAPGSNIDLKVDGAYEIFFDPAAPAGHKGADGMRLLAVEPERRLAFTWNAPASLPYARAQRTVVTVDFAPIGADSTRVTLRHIGWGSGPEWDAAIRYFEPAWNAFVMPMFRHRVALGPINWAAPPTVDPVQVSAIQELGRR